MQSDSLLFALPSVKFQKTRVPNIELIHRLVLVQCRYILGYDTIVSEDI